jgi:hypothetical protein
MKEMILNCGSMIKLRYFITVGFTPNRFSMEIRPPSPLDSPIREKLDEGIIYANVYS